jgi:hypothetical protein
MIIKIIPEGAETIKKVEHKGVKEFFIMGNKIDPDGSLIDYHDWSGSYRYLVGSLKYFAEVLNDERRAKGKFENKNEMDPLPRSFKDKGMFKNITSDKPNLKVLTNDEMNVAKEVADKFIKEGKGTNVGTPEMSVIEINNKEEMPVEEEGVDDKNKPSVGAEDEEPLNRDPQMTVQNNNDV